MSFKNGNQLDIMATTGDYLRIWRVNPDTGEAKMECLLNNVSISSFL